VDEFARLGRKKGKRKKEKGKRKKEKGATPVSAQMPSSGRSQYFPFESISVGKIS